MFRFRLDAHLVSPPPDYPSDLFKDVRQGLIGVGLINVEDSSGILTLDKDYNNNGKFLNCILDMEVHQQNALFQFLGSANGNASLGTTWKQREGEAPLSIATSKSDLMVNPPLGPHLSVRRPPKGKENTIMTFSCSHNPGI